MTKEMTLTERIALMVKLGEYITENSEEWQIVKDNAVHGNPWFTEEHVALATANIAREFLQEDKLKQWMKGYTMPYKLCKVGIVMAGNIPMVGFHDLLCGFMSGHDLLLKLSSKDEVLMKHIVQWMVTNAHGLASRIIISDRLNGCDAYIATGSNNTARYFEQYFSKFPHIIRRNRTSVAVLDGTETDEDIMKLGEDVYSYYGLGCRNVTQLCVPEGYNFERLLNVLSRFDRYADFNKYKNNYDYHLAIYLLNRVPYMSNASLLMVENPLPFSAVSVLHYRYYADKKALAEELKKSEDIQAVVGPDFLPFGSSQQPSLSDYADGVDTMQFLCNL
jgi:hypothetical protein